MADGGNGGNGGGIANSQGALTYAEDHTTFSDNATGDGGAGGTASGNGGNGGNGGAVSSVGNVSGSPLTQVYLLGANTKVAHNSTGQGGNSSMAGTPGNGGDGGGTWNVGANSEVLSSDASQIQSNTTGAAGTGGSGGTGGHGGGIAAPDLGTRVILKKGIISDNHAAAPNGGGGVWAPGPVASHTLTVDGTVIKDNTAAGAPNNCSPTAPGCPA